MKKAVRKTKSSMVEAAFNSNNSNSSSSSHDTQQSPRGPKDIELFPMPSFNSAMIAGGASLLTETSTVGNHLRVSPLLSDLSFLSSLVPRRWAMI
tara:strand:+ start:1133 stop:1417 length:285 start_codon:yes stop_codon:yes gene_type:complete